MQYVTILLSCMPDDSIHQSINESNHPFSCIAGSQPLICSGASASAISSSYLRILHRAIRHRRRWRRCVGQWQRSEWCRLPWRSLAPAPPPTTSTDGERPQGPRPAAAAAAAAVAAAVAAVAVLVVVVVVVAAAARRSFAACTGPAIPSTKSPPSSAATTPNLSRRF